MCKNTCSFFGMASLHNTPQERPVFGNMDHLVVDNAPIHRHDSVQILGDFLSHFGSFLIFTPFYSPEFNVVELVFSYLKQMLKQPFIRDLAIANLPTVVFAILNSVTQRKMQRFYGHLKYLPQ